MAVERALKFCWRIWQKNPPGNCWSKNEWMPAPFCAVGILQDFVYCSPGLPAYLAFVWTEFCSNFYKRITGEKKKENPRICFYLLPWVHSRPCPGVSAKPHWGNKNFFQLANGAMSILNRNNQETSISLNAKSPITEMGINNTYGSNVSKHFSALGSRSRRLELVSKIQLLQPDGGQEWS